MGWLTGGLVPVLLCDMVILADPFAVALEVDLCGGEGAAAQLDRLVLHDVGILRLLEEVGQWLSWCRWEGVREHLAARISACGRKEGSVMPKAGRLGYPLIPPGVQGRVREQQEETCWRRPL